MNQLIDTEFEYISSLEFVQQLGSNPGNEVWQVRVSGQLRSGEEINTSLLLKTLNPNSGMAAAYTNLCAEVLISHVLTQISTETGVYPYVPLLHAYCLPEELRNVPLDRLNIGIPYQDAVPFPGQPVRPFLVTDWLPGVTLNTLGPSELPRAAFAYREVAQIYTYLAREYGILVIDCRSQNAMVSDQDSPAQPFDFGGVYVSGDRESKAHPQVGKVPHDLPAFISGTCCGYPWNFCHQPSLKRWTAAYAYHFVKRCLIFEMLQTAFPGNLLYQLLEAEGTNPRDTGAHNYLQECFTHITGMASYTMETEAQFAQRLEYVRERLVTFLANPRQLGDHERAAQLTEFILQQLQQDNTEETFEDVVVGFFDIIDPNFLST